MVGSEMQISTIMISLVAAPTTRAALQHDSGLFERNSRLGSAARIQRSRNPIRLLRGRNFLLVPNRAGGDTDSRRRPCSAAYAYESLVIDGYARRRGILPALVRS